MCGARARGIMAASGIAAPAIDGWTAEQEAPVGPRTGDMWLQGLLVVLFVVLAAGAWSQLASNLFLWR